MNTRNGYLARILAVAMSLCGSIVVVNSCAMADEGEAEEEASRRELPASRPFHLSFTQGLPPQTDQVFKIAADHADMMTLHFVALSCYPYMGPSPAALPDDWFSSVARLAPSKPFAIAETGWAAEDIVMKKTPPLIPTDLNIAMSEEDQVQYVRLILEASHRLDGRFVVWFFAQDFDFLYKGLSGDQAAFWEFAKWWRDTGMVDGDGKPRKSLHLWDEWLKLPRTRDSGE